MTQDQHPITPPPELFKQWEGMPRSVAFEAAYRAGADQELDACCEWLEATSLKKLVNNQNLRWAAALQEARRPKPPSLKEQGMASLNEVIECLKVLAPGVAADGPAIETIRRALEALPDD